MRAEKPLMLMLLPMLPPSAAPIVTPGTLRTAELSDVTPWDCISALLMTTTDCGTSIRLGAARRLMVVVVTRKSSLGREPVTVTGCIVAGASDGAAGVFSVAGGGALGSGAWAGCCWATATPGVRSIPATAACNFPFDLLLLTTCSPRRLGTDTHSQYRGECESLATSIDD